MQIITGELTGHTNDYPLSRIGNPDRVLALDIETTGLSPQQNAIYLIGCAYREDGRWKRIQWFDETGTGESDILTCFLLFAKKYDTLLHYNGDRFDLPFLSARIVHNGLQLLPGAENFPAQRSSVDLYKVLQPYKKLFALSDLRQQTVEQFVGTGRTEDRSGRDLVRIYRAYIAAEASSNVMHSNAQEEQRRETDRAKHIAMVEQMLEQNVVYTEFSLAETAANPETKAGRAAMRAMLLEHNAADTEGLIAISDLLAWNDLFNADLSVYKAQANTYRDATGNPAQELIMYADAGVLAESSPDDAAVRFWEDAEALPPITANADSCYVSVNGRRITLKVPIHNGRAYYYYANYKDYYYLPELDQAIHKSISTFVDENRRIQATPRTCYTAKVGSFLPEWGLLHEPVFRREYDEKGAWFEFTQDMKKERSFFSEYASHVYRHILHNPA